MIKLIRQKNIPIISQFYGKVITMYDKLITLWNIIQEEKEYFKIESLKQGDSKLKKNV